MVGSRFWYTTLGATDSWSTRYEECVARGGANLGNLLQVPHGSGRTPSRLIDARHILWMAGLSKGDIQRDLPHTSFFLVAPTREAVWMYGYKEPSLISGRVLMAFVSGQTRMASMKLTLLPGSGLEELERAKIIAALDLSNW